MKNIGLLLVLKALIATNCFTSAQARQESYPKRSLWICYVNINSFYSGATKKYNACSGSITIPFYPITYDTVNCLPPRPDVDFEGA